jgi:hypothetical protein
MLLPLHQNVKIANRSFENVSQFKYLGMTATNQNLIQEKKEGTVLVKWFALGLLSTTELL